MPGKSQIADRIAARGWTRQAAGTAVDAVLEEISVALAAGERVTLTGFGTFEAAPRAARSARNPRTGESVAVAATTVARFHPGAALRARVAGASPSEQGDPEADEPVQARAAGAGTAGTRAIGAGTGVTSPDEPAETTRTIHRAKGADEVKVKKSGSTKKAPAKAPETSTGKKTDKKVGKKAGKKSAAKVASSKKTGDRSTSKAAAKKSADKKKAQTTRGKKK